MPRKPKPTAKAAKPPIAPGADTRRPLTAAENDAAGVGPR